jgi:putative ABC transport system substrate-binding protein
MQRRQFISLVGSAATLPFAARAQQAKPAIGYLYFGSRALNPGLPGFAKGLREIGYIEGQNITVEYRFADGQRDRLQTMAAELVRRGVAVIFAGDNVAAAAAHAVTATIPIVFWIGADPVKIGLVDSLGRPGGNVTGVTGLTSELLAKKMQLVHDLAPMVSVVGVLVNPANPAAAADTKEALDAARSLGVRVHVVSASSGPEIDAAFGTLTQRNAGALVLEGDPFFTTQFEHLIALAARHALPTIYYNPIFVKNGSLMSYNVNISDQYRLAATYVGRILRGEKPADLPVQQATKLELIINLKTAKALGLTVPSALLARADEVIE